MKTNNIFHFLIAVALSGMIVACTSDEHMAESKDLSSAVSEGEPTYATFSFRINDDMADTRTDMLTDQNETSQVQAKVSNFRLLIFGHDGLCSVNRVSTNGEPLTVLSSDGSVKIFVIANAENIPNIKALADNILQGQTTFASFQNLIYDLGNSPFTNIDKLSDLVNTTDGYIMTNAFADASSLFNLAANIDSVSSHNATGNVPSQNHFVIPIQRTVAKVTVYYESPSILNIAGLGRVQDLKYSIRNVNRSLYLFQHNASTLVQSPNNGITPTSPEEDPFVNYFYRDYAYSKDVLDHLTTGNAVYVTENLTQLAYYGNTTFASVQAVFVPNVDIVIDNFSFVSGTFTGITHPTTVVPGSDIILVKGGVSDMYFTDSVKAYKAAYCIKNSTDVGFNIANVNDLRDAYVVKYMGGKCYYRVDIKDPLNNYGILRNHHYRVKITALPSNLGGVVPNILNPGEDKDAPTYLTASIWIIPWLDNEMAGEGMKRTEM